MQIQQPPAHFPQHHYDYHPPPAFVQPAPQQPPQSMSTFKAFAEEAFKKCLNDDETQYVQKLMEKLYKRLEAEGTHETYMWNLEPTPLLPRELYGMVRASLAIQRAPPPRQEQQQQQYVLPPPPSQPVKRSRFEAQHDAPSHDTKYSTSTSSASSSSSSSSAYGAIGGRGTSSRDAWDLSSGADGGEAEDSGKYGPPKVAKLDKKAIKEAKEAKKAAKEEAAAAKKKGAKGEQANKPNSKLAAPKLSKEEAQMRERRGNRFQSESYKPVHIVNEQNDYQNEYTAPVKVIGTCQTLEKGFLRLTSAPDPKQVRPRAVLQRAVAALQAKWNSQSLEYEDTTGQIGMCSQLKAVRQDLTVQHIVDEFTVSIYELHARVALEQGDMNEYNQCQTQLKHLYNQGLGARENIMEFTAYRILYYVYLQENSKYKGGNQDLANVMASLSCEAEEDAAVAHALHVREAIHSANYLAFFRLYQSTPNQGQCILRLMLQSRRLLALQTMCRCYKPTLPVAHVSNLFSFSSLDECCIFLLSAGCKFIKPVPGTTMAEVAAGGTAETLIGKAEFREYREFMAVGGSGDAAAGDSAQKSAKRAKHAGKLEKTRQRVEKWGSPEEWEISMANTVINFAGVMDVNDDLL